VRRPCLRRTVCLSRLSEDRDVGSGAAALKSFLDRCPGGLAVWGAATGIDANSWPPFVFSGKIGKITLTIDRPKPSPEDIKKLS
jgi:hypothetical protein